MTLIRSISSNHQTLTCKRCNHTGLVDVADLLNKLPQDTNVHDVLKKARCSECGSKAINDFRILYVGASFDALKGGRQDSGDKKEVVQ